MGAPAERAQRVIPAPETNSMATAAVGLSEWATQGNTGGGETSFSAARSHRSHARLLLACCWRTALRLPRRPPPATLLPCHTCFRPNWRKWAGGLVPDALLCRLSAFAQAEKDAKSAPLTRCALRSAVVSLNRDATVRSTRSLSVNRPYPCHSGLAYTAAPFPGSDAIILAAPPSLAR